jgi:hypothetical protein
MDKQANSKQRLKPPVCPYCQSEMSRIRFSNYYDSFDYWDCECKDDEIPIDHKFHSSP